MLSSEMTAGSGASVSLSMSGWGDGDPGMGMKGMHLRVLGGWLVWPLAFHELAVAGDCRDFVEQWMAEGDFTPNPFGPRMAGALFLNCVLRGDAVDWTTHDMCRQVKSNACWRHSGCITFGCDVRSQRSLGVSMNRR
jgi:hypothetical protein